MGDTISPGDDTEWITILEAAGILGITRRRVGQLIATDRLPAVRDGRQWRLRRCQVQVIANARRARWHG